MVPFPYRMSGYSDWLIVGNRVDRDLRRFGLHRNGFFRQGRFRCRLLRDGFLRRDSRRCGFRRHSLSGLGHLRCFLRSGVHGSLPYAFVREKHRRYQRNGNDHNQAGCLYISCHLYPPMGEFLSVTNTVPAHPRKRRGHLLPFRRHRWGFSPPAPMHGSSPLFCPGNPAVPRKQGRHRATADTRQNRGYRKW